MPLAAFAAGPMVNPAHLATDIKAAEVEIHQIVGEKFNVDSPKQLGTVLFEKMKISSDIKKTKTGQYSTDEATLSSARAGDPSAAVTV